ncbi:hypothetical protein ARC78_09370 [Stenotrophomonas pictorum JCM 9942]|uniref:Uncharacterized protein n=1 Tax=Stenotrophomonas pictorum JCM 9942 TaxID=1236960 RepID=A0A0R0AC14_9GAMM|nr:hypothetical protein [Stenotrophomonas pictorum]KRG42333.1 hypothetical protein ARC78_09370 [Stenotrophomonas pictorum JCM 9942]
MPDWKATNGQDIQDAEIVPTTVGQYVRGKFGYWARRYVGMRVVMDCRGIGFGLALLVSTAQVAAQNTSTPFFSSRQGPATTADVEGPLRLFDNGVKACKLMLLTNAPLANSFVRSNSGGVTEVCECTSLLTVSHATRDDLQEVLSGGGDASRMIDQLKSNFLLCNNIGG